VTTQFSGLVMAYETQSEEAFLTTQQVDEARHAQHFNRFYEQVLGLDDTFERRLAHARRHLSEDFVALFDRHLVNAGDALVADPADVGAKVDFVTTYHMVIEGTLALTGQNFITRAFEERGILPGFTEGFRRIATDEHRHVAYGTWFLQQKSSDPRLRRRIADRILALLPTAAGVLVPPGADPDDWTLLGYGAEEIDTFAFTALTRRLKVIGVDLAAAAAETVRAAPLVRARAALVASPGPHRDATLQEVSRTHDDHHVRHQDSRPGRALVRQRRPPARRRARLLAGPAPASSTQ
jgi:ribonucleoside-diphosphate reductase beta chain